MCGCLLDLVKMFGVVGWLLLLCFCFAGCLIASDLVRFVSLIDVIGLIGCLRIYVVC